MPALEAAQEALAALNKSDIGEIKAMNKPPSMVQLVMEVCSPSDTCLVCPALPPSALAARAALCELTACRNCKPQRGCSRSGKDHEQTRADTCPLLQAVCVCRSLPTEWEEVRRMLADASFMRALLEYDRDHIPVDVIARLKPYMSNPDFQPEAVGRQSKAARSLCMWVRAVFGYNAALQVRPSAENQSLTQLWLAS